MSLQEVIIPVVSINKGRQSDSRPVDVTILRGSSTTISTSQISVTLYQELPVEEKHILAPYALVYTEMMENYCLINKR